MDDFRIRHKPAFHYARTVIDAYSKSFAISSRLLPQKTRWAVYSMYGLCRYADNLIDKPRSRTIDEIVEEIEALKKEIIIAYRTGESEHPVVTSFIEVASHFRIPLEYPLDFLKGIMMDAEKRRYKTFDELYVFCYRVAGIVGLMMAHVLGFRSKAALPYAEKLGVAMQLTNILRDVEEDWLMGRIYLPQDEMEDSGVTELMLQKRNMNSAMKTLISHQVNRAHQLYEDAHPGIAMLIPQSQFAIYCASRIYRGILYKIESNEYNPFTGRLYLTTQEKIGIILREKMRHLNNHRAVR
jgi:phytoene synthase